MHGSAHRWKRFPLFSNFGSLGAPPHSSFIFSSYWRSWETRSNFSLRQPLNHLVLGSWPETFFPKLVKIFHIGVLMIFFTAILHYDLAQTFEMFVKVCVFRPQRQHRATTSPLIAPNPPSLSHSRTSHPPKKTLSLIIPTAVHCPPESFF